MSKLLTSIFFSLYLIALIRPITPYIEYAINQNYIASVLCINKNKPKLKCNGKCHLNSQLKKAYEQDQSKNKTIPLKIELEKYPIGFIQKSDYSKLDHKYLQKKSFLYNTFIVKELFIEQPTPPPKLFS